MRVTVEELRRIVSEAFGATGTEEVDRGLNEVTALTVLDPTDLLEFADAWASLGDAVQQQVKDVLSMGPEADVNPNAIQLALDRLGGFNEELDQALQEFMDDLGAASGDEEEDPYYGDERLRASMQWTDR